MKRRYRIGASIGKLPVPPKPRLTPIGMTTSEWKRPRREKNRRERARG